MKYYSTAPIKQSYGTPSNIKNILTWNGCSFPVPPKSLQIYLSLISAEMKLTWRMLRQRREWAHLNLSGGSQEALLQSSFVSSELSPQSLSPSHINFRGIHTELPHSNSNGLHARRSGYKLDVNIVNGNPSIKTEQIDVSIQMIKTETAALHEITIHQLEMIRWWITRGCCTGTRNAIKQTSADPWIKCQRLSLFFEFPKVNGRKFYVQEYISLSVYFNWKSSHFFKFLRSSYSFRVAIEFFHSRRASHYDYDVVVKCTTWKCNQLMKIFTWSSQCNSSDAFGQSLRLSHHLCAGMHVPSSHCRCPGVHWRILHCDSSSPSLHCTIPSQTWTLKD